jgi:hypothetical protein
LRKKKQLPIGVKEEKNSIAISVHMKQRNPDLQLRKGTKQLLTSIEEEKTKQNSF